MDELKKEPLTSFLVLLNVLIFILVEFTGSSQNTAHMLECGAAFTPFIIEEHEYYRIFTSMFLHFGMTHLAHNMLVLFVLGGRLERTIGKIRFIFVYLAGGIAGNLISLFLDFHGERHAVSAGASGAVFAILGGLLYVIILKKGRVEDLSTRQIVIMAVLSLYFGFASQGVDNAAHVGGFLGGIVFSALSYHPSRIRKDVP